MRAYLIAITLTVPLFIFAQDASYFDNTGRDDILSGGVKMIPIETPAGTFNVCCSVQFCDYELMCKCK